MKNKIVFLFGSILGGIEAAVLNVGSNGVVSGVDRDQSSAISALVAMDRGWRACDCRLCWYNNRV